MCPVVEIFGKRNNLSKYGYFYFPFDQLSEIHTKNCIQETSCISSSSLICADSSVSLTVTTAKPFPSIKNVYFNNPVTVVIWDDGTKTIVKCQEQTGDTYSKETGLAMCIAKKAMGNKGRYYDIFKKWIPEEDVGFIDGNNKKSCSTCKHRFGDCYECSDCGRYYEMWEANE